MKSYTVSLDVHEVPESQIDQIMTGLKNVCIQSKIPKFTIGSYSEDELEIKFNK